MNYEERLQDLLDELDLFQDWTERYEYIIAWVKNCPGWMKPTKRRTPSSRDANPAYGCTRNRTMAY